jgi:hypothetical protein
VIDATKVDASKDTAGNIAMPLVKIHSADSSWGGYTELMTLHPIIPKGTLIYFKREGSDTLRLASTQQSDSGLNLGDSITAQLVRYDPATSDRDLYVTILAGQYAGRSGWMFTLEGSTSKGDPMGTFLQSATEAAPEPPKDPNSKTYVTYKDIRAFNDISVCEDAMNAMSSDDAYQGLQDAVASGNYVDFPKGTRLHVVSDPQPDSPFLIASDDQGNQGCVGRYELPGYGQ